MCASYYSCEDGICVEDPSCDEEDCDIGGGYTCDTSLDACYTSCTPTSVECANGYLCARDATCSRDADGDGTADVDEPTCLDALCNPYVCDTTLDSCLVSCTSNSHCFSGYACSSVFSCSPDSDGDGTADVDEEVCTDGKDNDGDATVDNGGVDTDGDGDIEYNSGCVKKSSFVKYGSKKTKCSALSSYQCQGLTTGKFSKCPSGTYISQDSDCSSSSSSVKAAPEVEMGFWAKLWSWITGA